MSKMIQLRNVPDSLHRRLKAKAAMAGKSLSDYLTDELKLVAERPSLEELWARIKSHGPVELTESSAETIRRERKEHMRAKGWLTPEDELE
jgi:plasmid stability protein